MKDADWIRSIAAKPPALRQPIYESLRLNAIAARLELAEQQNQALKDVLHTVAVFMQAQEDGDFVTAEGAYLAFKAALADVMATEEPDAIVTEVEVAAWDGSPPAVVRTTTEVRHNPTATRTPPTPPNTVDADPTAPQEDSPCQD